MDNAPTFFHIGNLGRKLRADWIETVYGILSICEKEKFWSCIMLADDFAMQYKKLLEMAEKQDCRAARGNTLFAAVRPCPVPRAFRRPFYVKIHTFLRNYYFL